MIPARGVAAYPLLLALGALDAAGYSVIVPVAPAIADATGAGPAIIGLLVASFPAGMVAGFGGAAIGGVELGSGSALTSRALWALLYITLAALIGLGVGMIIRHSAGAISGLLMWSFVVESLFASDLAFLQDLYRRINQEGHTQAAVTCPHCSTEFTVDIAGDASGGS